jgi:hypothetical protein
VLLIFFLPLIGISNHWFCRSNKEIYSKFNFVSLVEERIRNISLGYYMFLVMPTLFTVGIILFNLSNFLLKQDSNPFTPMSISFQYILRPIFFETLLMLGRVKLFKEIYAVVHFIQPISCWNKWGISLFVIESY